MLVREQRVAAERGHFECVKDRAQVGFIEECHVAVPSAAEVEPIVGLGDDLDDLGMRLHAFDEGVGVELAEIATKSQLGLWAQVLVIEEQDMVCQEHLPDL